VLGGDRDEPAQPLDILLAVAGDKARLQGRHTPARQRPEDQIDVVIAVGFQGASVDVKREPDAFGPAVADDLGQVQIDVTQDVVVLFVELQVRHVSAGDGHRIAAGVLDPVLAFEPLAGALGHVLLEVGDGFFAPPAFGAVPAPVDVDVAEVVLGGEVHVPLEVLRLDGPAVVDEDARLDPRRVRDRARRIEVLDEGAPLDQSGCVRREDQASPGECCWRGQCELALAKLGAQRPFIFLLQPARRLVRHVRLDQRRHRTVAQLDGQRDHHTFSVSRPSPGFSNGPGEGCASRFLAK